MILDINQQCVQCSPNCHTCSSSTQCSNCAANYKLASGKCNSCTDNAFLSNGVCIHCSPKCVDLKNTTLYGRNLGTNFDFYRMSTTL
jgi:hypothetical protein